MNVDPVTSLHPITLEKLSDRPFVSILTPCYNASKYIELTVKSIQSQTYPNWEMIVCDDGSQDDSWTNIQAIAEREPRVIPIRQQNGGSASATNAAYLRSSGEIVAFLDADDLSAPRRIETIVKAFQRAPEAGFLSHRLKAINSEGEPLEIILPGHERLVSGWFAPKVFEMRKYGCSAPSSGIAARRDVLEQIMPIPARCKRTQDAFVISASLLLTPAIGIEEELGYYRIHSGGQTSGKRFHEDFHNGKIVDQVNLGISIGEFIDTKGDEALRKWSDSGMISNCQELMSQIALYWLCTGRLHEMSPHNLAEVFRHLGALRWPLELVRISPRFIRFSICSILRMYDHVRK